MAARSDICDNGDRRALRDGHFSRTRRRGTYRGCLRLWVARADSDAAYWGGARSTRKMVRRLLNHPRDRRTRRNVNDELRKEHSGVCLVVRGGALGDRLWCQDVEVGVARESTNREQRI